MELPIANCVSFFFIVVVVIVVATVLLLFLCTWSSRKTKETDLIFLNKNESAMIKKSVQRHYKISHLWELPVLDI